MKAIGKEDLGFQSCGQYHLPPFSVWGRGVAILLGLLLSPVISASIGPGAIQNVNGWSVGAPRRFSNEIMSFQCYPLVSSSSEVEGWIHAIHRFGGRTVVRRCLELYANDEDSEISWGIRPVWEEAYFDESDLRFHKIDIPGYDSFSNPTFCASKVAYWVRVDALRSLRVYDLNTRALRVSPSFEYPLPESDFPPTFPYAKWDKDCDTFELIHQPEP